MCLLELISQINIGTRLTLLWTLLVSVLLVLLRADCQVHGPTFDGLGQGKGKSARSSFSFSWKQRIVKPLDLRQLGSCHTDYVFLQLPRPQRFPSSYLSRVETLVETVSEHIFWKNKDLAEETRSANLAVAAFVKVGAKRLMVFELKCERQTALMLWDSVLEHIWRGTCCTMKLTVYCSGKGSIQTV